MNKIKMLNSNVLITLDNVQNVTGAGIILSPNTNKSYNTATVVAVPEGQDIVKMNDKIYIPLYAGTELVMDGVTYNIINIKEIILIV